MHSDCWQLWIAHRWEVAYIRLAKRPPEAFQPDHTGCRCCASLYNVLFIIKRRRRRKSWHSFCFRSKDTSPKSSIVKAQTHSIPSPASFGSSVDHVNHLFSLLSPVLTKLFAQSTLMINLEGGQVCSQWRLCRIFSFSSCCSSNRGSLTHTARKNNNNNNNGGGGVFSISLRLFLSLWITQTNWPTAWCRICPRRDGSETERGGWLGSITMGADLMMCWTSKKKKILNKLRNSLPLKTTCLLKHTVCVP